jgi:membrane protease YdiL (CAAX protease family)
MEGSNWAGNAVAANQRAFSDYAPGRRQQFWELVVFLVLIAPSMGLSLFVVRQGGLSFPLTAVATILRDVGLVSLIAFFLWRNGEPRGRIGWTFRNAQRDVLLGILLFLPMFYGAAALEQVLRASGFTTPATPTPRFLTAGSPAQFLLASVLVVIVAIAEETIFRGYLILRLTALTKSKLAAAILSSIIFGVGHGYEGTAGLVTVGFMGLLFAFVYLSRKSLVAPMTMHFLQDFIAIVLLPLLRHHS